MSSGSREVKIVNVEVDDVKFISDETLENSVEHHKMMRNLVDATAVEPQGFSAARNQFRRRDRVAARKQSNFVSLLHKLFGQVGNDAFGTAVKFRGHAFIKW